ncbi:MAG: UDP-N-acetyl glucosamine 2-epimerase, partial [Flavobacteriales bacterium]|nr:UDP-N-acetyl glucosamine 2-epimerase [Flavobacteriales bacterium]
FLDAAGKNASETIGQVIIKVDQIIESVNPEAILILGDTNSCLSAIPAKRRKVPIFHMEAGNRCFDLRVPEEINRKIVDHTSDINMVLTEHARRYLIAEGIRPEMIIKTGSSMKEVLDFHKNQIEASSVLSDLGLEKKDYFLVSAHREENIDLEKNFRALMESLNAIVEKYEKRIIVSTHPRTRKKLELLGEGDASDKIEFMKPLGFFDYIALQQNAICVVSDSGTITEECSLLNFPAVTIRQAHERPEGMDEGTLIMCGVSKDHVIESIEAVTAQHLEGDFKVISDYNVENVSKKVLRIIMSYTEYINREVWHQ